MDINDNQQINSFVKGMNTDVSDLLMDSSLYRYAENVRLVTNTDSNSGELRLIEGVEDLDGWTTKPQNPAIARPDLEEPIEQEGIPEPILAMTSIRDILIVISAGRENNPLARFRNCIYKKDTSKPDSRWVRIFVPDPEDDEFGEHLSLVTRWETDDLVKLYIADGVHQLMYINVNDPRFDGNTDDPIIGMDNLYATAEELIYPLLALISESVGNIPPAKVQYTYRYYKLGGSSTSLAPMSNVLALYKGLNEGYEYDEKHTKRAVDLTIPQSPIPALTKIQIFRIIYHQIGQLPLVSMVYDGDIRLSFTDTGYDVESLTLEDLLSYIKMLMTPTVIESKNDYLFAGNIKYNDSEFEQYLRDNNIDDMAKAPSTGCSSTSDGHNIQFDNENILNYNYQYWLSEIDNTLGGEGDYVKWQYCNEYFYSTVDNRKTHHGKDSLSGVNNIISGQYPSLRHGEVYRYGMILYNAKGQKSSVKWIADIMIPNMSYSLMNHIPYKWMEDPSDNYISKYKLWRVGINFTIKSSFWEKLQDVVAVEIVRAERTSADRICLTQGIIGFPYRVWRRATDSSVDYTEETPYLCSPGFLSVNNITASSEETGDEDRHRTKGVTDNKYLIFSSPEVCYQTDDIRSLLDSKRNNLYVCPVYRNVYQSRPITTNVMYGILGNSSWDNIPGVLIWRNLYGLNYAPCFEKDTSTSPDGLKFTRAMGLDQVLFRFVPENHEEAEQFDYTTLTYIPRTTHVYKNLSTFHCIPYTFAFSSEHSNIAISKFSVVGQEEANSFFIGDENKIPTVDKALTMLDGDQIMHWTNPMLIEYDHVWGDMLNEDSFTHDDGNRYPIFYPVGSMGRSIVMRLEEQMTVDSLYDDTHVTFQTVDIKTKTVPYGGMSTINTGNYISFGNFIQRSKSLVFDMWNDVSMDVYDGDCYPGVFNYTATHAWYEPNMCCGVRMASFYSVPIESDIDLSATYGDLYTSLNSGYRYYLQDKKTVISNIFTLSKDMYEYNTAYGSMPTAILYAAVGITDLDTSYYDTRIHNSELKTNGEHIDNWLMFRANNFIDVDTRFGAITNMRLYKDDLLYWQEHATGVISSNERTVLNDIDHNLIVLGTGGVLLRYDYISTMYGMKPNQYEAEVQSNTTQYWWDGTNKELLGYSGGRELVPLAKVKNCSNYINKYNEVDHPSLSYDPKFNELVSSVVNKGSIVYNENVQQFTSVYTFNPIFRATTGNILHITSDSRIYQWNKQEDPTLAVLFSGSEYINAKPKVQYVVNKGNGYNKVFDITTFGGRFYGGDEEDVDKLTFKFDTPLKQHSQCTGSDFITNREYDFRLAIPRNNDDYYGGRMRGKTMQCELSSSSNSTDFSLQYIITKYRMSWS